MCLAIAHDAACPKVLISNASSKLQEPIPLCPRQMLPMASKPRKVMLSRTSSKRVLNTGREQYPICPAIGSVSPHTHLSWCTSRGDIWCAAGPLSRYPCEDRQSCDVGDRVKRRSAIRGCGEKAWMLHVYISGNFGLMLSICRHT